LHWNDHFNMTYTSIYHVKVKQNELFQ
jgi:hypothetical protein